MPQPTYKYEVTFASGRTEKFSTSKPYAVLEDIDIECLNKDGIVCGYLSINKDLVESVFVKIEPSFTLEQQDLQGKRLAWYKKGKD